MIVTSGFSKQAEREFGIWDLRNLSEGPVATGALGDGSGVGHIYFDRGHNLLYTSGRGDSRILIHQYDESHAAKMYPLNPYAYTQPIKAVQFLPKH